MAVEFGLIASVGVYNPVYATRRLELTPADRVARTLSAWTVSGKLTTAALTALWGLLVGPDRDAYGRRARGRAAPDDPAAAAATAPHVRSLPVPARR